MSTTRVVHVSDNVPGAIYIGRAMPRRGLKASPLANQFKIGRDGTRAEVISRYREFIAPIAQDDENVKNTLRELVGKPLACWCRRDGDERTADNACHGDTLVALIRELGLEGDEQEDAT